MSDRTESVSTKLVSFMHSINYSMLYLSFFATSCSKVLFGS